MKKSIKTLISFVVVGLLVSAFLPLIGFAQDPLQPVPDPVTSVEDVGTILNRVAMFVWLILGAIVVIMFVWAGITFVTAEGDPTKIQSARNRVLYGIIGVVVALLAAGLVALIQNILKTQ